MSYLGFDTSIQTLSVALGNESVIQAEYTSNTRKDHSSRLMPVIDRMMQESGVQPRDLQGIIVAQGPGSYTGLRIGVSAAKSMAWALNIPLLGISSLSLIARSCKYFAGYVVPLIDARRGQVYTGLYRFQGLTEDGGCQYDAGDMLNHMENSMQEQDRLVMLQDWLVFLKEKYCNPSEGETPPLLFVGNDLSIHRELIASIIPESHLCFAGVGSLSSRAAELLEVGIPMLKQGISHDAKSFAPEYLRLAEAEQNWLNQQSSPN